MTTAVAAAVAVAMTIPLTACGGQEQAAVDKNGKPIVRIMVRRNVTDNPIEDMGYDDELEAACDCTIEWSEVDDNSWGQQKAPRMAAGEFPDIGLTLYDYTDISRFYSEFLDLAPYLDRMPNVKKFFEDRPVALKMAQDGDKIYSIPSDRGKGYRVSATHMFINKTWLDDLGFDVPTTWDELEDVLEAFKIEDPNGNGETDTRAVALQDRFGGYIPDDVTMINDTNAEYVTASDEACREALANVDPTGDVIPIYVRPDSSDMETLQNNNTSIGNYANNMIAQWFQNGGIDEQWDEYVAKLNTPSLGLQDNIDIWQKYYDEAVK